MPIYEYKCQKCEGIFDKLIRGFSQNNKICCDFCKSPEVKKLISAFAFTGSGNTDKKMNSGSSCSSCSHSNCSSCG